MSNGNGWIGVDLDRTLAHYDGWKGAGHIGAPVPLMLERVKIWLQQGQDVRIFTARIHPLDRCIMPGVPILDEIRNGRIADAVGAVSAIRIWCMTHLGRELPITNIKDYAMIELWDDLAVGVVQNTGEVK